MLRVEMKIMKTFLLVISFLLGGGLLGADIDKASVQWQKMELEASLKERVSNIAKQLIDKEKFFVEIQVMTKKPSTNLPRYDFAKKNKKRIKFTDSKKNSNGEYILFDKLGLNAPKYSNGQEVTTEELKLKIFQYQQRVERDFINKMDIFSNIEKVIIKVGVEKSVSTDKIEKLKNLLGQLIPILGEIKPEVEVLSLDFDIAKDQESFAKTMSYITGPLGIVVASLLFCLTAFLLFNKYKALQAETAKQEASIEEEERELRTESRLPNLDNSIDPNLRPGSSQLAEAIKETHEGIQRYCLYLDKSYEQATNLVKKWINLNSKLSNSALVILSERLSVEELYKVFMKLTSDERDEYTKRTTSAELSLNAKNIADKYIGQQVLEDIITVSVTEDEELQTLLVELTPEKAAELVSGNIEEGAVLINLMGGDFLAQMFKFVEVDKTKELTTRALTLKEDEVKNMIASLKVSLEEFADKSYKNPFERRVIEVMKDLDYKRQESFLDVLIESKQFYIIEDVIKSTFPVRLIDKLPGSILKGIFKDMQIDLKVEFLASLDEKKRQSYIRKTTQSGTKGREVIEFELNRVLENEEAMEYVQEKKDEIHSVFINLVQNRIKSDEIAQKKAFEVAKKWFDEISSSESNQVVNLDLAA